MPDNVYNVDTSILDVCDCCAEVGPCCDVTTEDQFCATVSAETGDCADQSPDQLTLSYAGPVLDPTFGRGMQWEAGDGFSLSGTHNIRLTCYYEYAPEPDGLWVMDEELGLDPPVYTLVSVGCDPFELVFSASAAGVDTDFCIGTYTVTVALGACA